MGCFVMKKNVLISLLILFLTACGGDDSTEESSVSSDSKASAKVSNSLLSKFMDKSSICKIISVEDVQKSFNSTDVITLEPVGYNSKRSSSVTCNYSWGRADAQARKEKFSSYIIDQMQGKIEKIPMRERTLEHNFSLRLEAFKGQPEKFMPAKLSEEQLEKQISQAQKRAAERLSDKQKKIAGKAANSMMERLLRQNNENIKVAGVGDSAYWTTVGGGSLFVLSGNMKVSISPMIGDTLKEDIENAKLIAQLLPH
jgi:hypothetical protein